MQASEADPSPQQQIKLSQRPTKSCTECIRRKTRCNKQIPCDVCTKRRVKHLCKLETQYAYPTTSPKAVAQAPMSELEILRQSVYEEIHSLKSRVYELEKDVARQGKRPDQPAPTVGSDEPEDEDAATTLEFFALGLDRRVRGAVDGIGNGTTHPNGVGISASRPQRDSAKRYSHILSEAGPHPPDTVTDSLLPLHVVRAVLQYHERSVYWQHACVYFPDIWDEVGVFYTLVDQGGWDRVDGGWIALFYILQAIAVHQMNDTEAVQCGLNEADRFVLPTALIASAQSALQHASFLSKPSLFTCQACAILCLCGHNVCASDLLSSLLAIGIKTAQTMNLHSLGRARNMDAVQREVGTRVWWALTMEDWFAIPFRGVWSVHPDHFDTPLPSNCHDTDLAAGRAGSRPESEITVGFKSRFSAQSASILQFAFHRLRHASSARALAIASESSNRIRNLISLLPPAQPDLPRWTADMRHYLMISSSHKVLVIYRAVLARGGSPTDRARAQSECLKAAEAIIEEMDTRSGSQTLWTIPYHTLAAGVVLALEVISSKGEQNVMTSRRGAVDKARKALQRLSPTSRIARRGLQVLEDLMSEVGYQGKRKRDTDGVARIIKKIKLPDDVLLESAPQTPLGTLPSHLSENITLPSIEQAVESTSPPNFGWSPGDMDALLASLQETVPDVGRLFDGSLGDFGFGFAGGAS